MISFTIRRLKPRLVTELLDLANVYVENQLKRRCIQIIKQGITVVNVAFLYSTAIEYNAQVSLTNSE